jgi:hypothetical protein
MKINELCKSIMQQPKNEKQQQKLDVKSGKNIKKQRTHVMKTGLDGTMLRTIVIVPPLHYYAYPISNNEGENFELVIKWRFQCTPFYNWGNPFQGNWNLVVG